MSTCQPTKTPPPETVDIPALQRKYVAERARRMRSEGGEQYVRPTGKLASNYAADPYMATEPRAPISEELDVLVLGAGWGGIMASYYLTKEGVTNFRNIDHAGDFGGVWYWNRYPGLQCDNDSYCYLPLLEEMGFMPSKQFTDGWEIQQYAKSIATKFGFADKGVFHTIVKSMVWNDQTKRWLVTTDRGDEFRAKFVIVAAGVLNMPKLPGIPGIETFKGKMFHSARWDYAYTGGDNKNPVLDKLGDKTVAIIGTGATAIQAVPFLAKYAKQLYVIQRTPSSVDERHNPQTDPEWAKALKPGWQKERQANFHRAAMEFLRPDETDLICDIWTEISRNLHAELAAEGWPLLQPLEFLARRDLVDYRVMERLRARVEAIVKDKETAEALKPYYRFLCKRPLSNDEYYPVFNQPNVKLIDVSETKGVERMTEKGFVANGKEYQADCIIFASGFEVSSELERRWGIDKIEGRNGNSLYAHWSDGPKTLHGTMTHFFPNQFYIGYIQGALNASVTEQFGQQGRHSAHIIAEALRHGVKSVEPSQEAQDDYVRRFNEQQMDVSEFQKFCPPSYFTNEGDSHAKWALFRAWGPGWDHFQNMLEEWRQKGDMEGMIVTK